MLTGKRKSRQRKGLVNGMLSKQWTGYCGARDSAEKIWGEKEINRAVLTQVQAEGERDIDRACTSGRHDTEVPGGKKRSLKKNTGRRRASQTERRTVAEEDEREEWRTLRKRQ